ncbi:MAG: hypothetical protein LC667_19370 [Thioalkalivibrio sp.]|nr:hypothetical protein [Thioalkalivibrio sp.]
MVGLTLGLLFNAAPVEAQSRRLGPETANSIQEAKLDPTFQTTQIKRIVLVPLANTGGGDAKDAGNVVARNLVAQLAQFHPEYEVIPPDELMNFVTTSKLDDQFNMFFGDYLSTGTVRRDFIDILRDKLKADAVFIGEITAYGETKATGGARRFIPGKKESVVSLKMGLYRTSDGRLIWSGRDSIAAQQASDLPSAAEAIGEVFARFLGRRAY